VKKRCPRSERSSYSKANPSQSTNATLTSPESASSVGKKHASSPSSLTKF